MKYNYFADIDNDPYAYNFFGGCHFEKGADSPLASIGMFRRTAVFMGNDAPFGKRALDEDDLIFFYLDENGGFRPELEEYPPKKISSR